jgi:hypothetical protein
MRVVTRGDLDGLTCALLLASCERVEDVELVHPQEIVDRRFPVTSNDILANLPFHPACAMWFDNHLLTDESAMPPPGFAGRYALAASAARVVYEHYLPRNPALRRFEALLEATDRLDSAQLGEEDVLAPKGYILLGYTLDPRTGLGAFREYFRLLLDALESRPIDVVLALPEVELRVSRILEQDRAFRQATLAHSRLAGNVVVTDFRSLETIPVGNRFLVYTLFREANVSVRVHWGPRREKVVVSVGRSVFNRTCRTNVGVLMSMYGGGGHKGAGSCTLVLERADGQIREMIETLKRNG